MKCPVCDSDTSVYATKAYDTLKVRYRRCTNCGGKYLSHEELQTDRMLRAYKGQKPRTGQDERPLCLKCGGPLLAQRVTGADGSFKSYRCAACRVTFRPKPNGEFEEIGTKLGIIEAEIGHRTMP